MESNSEVISTTKGDSGKTDEENNVTCIDVLCPHSLEAADRPGDTTKGDVRGHAANSEFSPGAVCESSTDKKRKVSTNVKEIPAVHDPAGSSDPPTSGLTDISQQTVTIQFVDQVEDASESTPTTSASNHIIVLPNRHVVQVSSVLSGDHAMAIAENENNMNALQASQQQASEQMDASSVLVWQADQMDASVLTLNGVHIVEAAPILTNADIKHDEIVIAEGAAVVAPSTDAVSASPKEDAKPAPSIMCQVLNEDGTAEQVNITSVDRGSGTAKVMDCKQEESFLMSSSPGKPFQCDLCSASFTKLGNYTRHRMIHTVNVKDDNYRYKCKECKRQFLQRCDLKRHMHIHSGTEPFRCHVCSKGYIRKSDLVVHLRFHNQQRAFKCPQCDRAYFQSGDMYRHIRRFHSQRSPLTCGHCGKEYCKETTLLRHIQADHRDIILNSLKTGKGQGNKSEVEPSEDSVVKESKNSESGEKAQANTSCKSDIDGDVPS